MARAPRLKQLIIVFLVLVVGAGITLALSASKKAPSRKVKAAIGPLVNVEPAVSGDFPMVVTGHGSVRARVQVQVIPQVSGKVVKTHPSLVSGGFFKKGETLLRIDPRDYRVAVQRAEANVARAEVQLELDRAEARIAREEWDRLNPGKEPSSPLVVHKPQVDRSRAELQAARADLAAAKLNLERTRLKLPFNGRVASEQVDVGQFVITGQPVASVYGTDVLEVSVPLEDEQFAWFTVPGAGGRMDVADVEPARASIRGKIAGAGHEWEGRVIRTEGELDPKSRMMNVVVEVKDPFAVEGGASLVPGMFVDVAIQGRELDNVFSIPRYALREGNNVWVVEDGRLRVKEVRVERKDGEMAYVSSGLDSGAQVVVSSLDAVTDGMVVRVPSAGGDAS